ncbi:MAG: ATP-binding protein [Nostoc sp.]|uniref:AAA family ATPase n=1 Tax=Nostoc sp. TaxID=1180 RepID=UPI002FF62700
MAQSIQSLHVRRFKGILDAPFDVSSMTVLIGANNSGKSTIAQLIHFTIGLLQAVTLADRWGNQESTSVSLSPQQLLYSPCSDLYALGHNGRLKEDANSAIEIDVNLSDGNTIKVTIKRGRNGNINVTILNTESAKSIASLSEPFTIYSPGLAGIARHETYMSDGVLLRTIARGDANLAFRNVLLRLSAQSRKDNWDSFIGDLQEIFSNISIKVDFNEKTDEYILVTVDSGAGKDIPVELAGTGILQAVQILAYVHYFHPSVIILDEPDSHLHPNNQRLLCRLLQSVSEDRSTQVILTTHSRHVVDALSGQAMFLWVRSGTAERFEQDHDLAVLLDIGALDIKEMVSHSNSKRCIVLTEDTHKRPLEKVLWSSGIPESDTLVLAYHGCTSPQSLRPLIDLIRAGNSHATIVVHRDRDYFNEIEAEEWQKQIRNLKAKPFLTKGVDIESHFLCHRHIANLNNIAEIDASELITQATKDSKDLCIKKYVNGRSDIEKKSGGYGKLDFGELAVEAPKILDDDPERYRHSKTILKKVRSLFQDKYNRNIKIIEQSEFIKDLSLEAIANSLPK